MKLSVRRWGQRSAMRFNQWLFYYLAGATTAILACTGAYSFAEEEAVVHFSVKPTKCIALHKGQDCYQKLKFSWQTPQVGKYCIYAESQRDPLVCWQGQSRSMFVYEFVGKQTQRFYLRNEANANLYETELVVTWVYTSSKRDSGGWRLF